MKQKRQNSKFLRFLKILGPGFVTGASDDDPSGIGTYLQVGAAFGFATLWTALITFPLMTAVQYICGKIGMVTGQGVAAVLKTNYPKTLIYPVIIALAIANTINAGADLGAIADAVNLLVPVPVRVSILPICIIILAVQIWGSYRLIARVFKWLSLALLAYMGAAVFAKPNFREVAYGTFVPQIRLDGKFLEALVAIFGTTISPYLFFWQANQEVEEDIKKGHTTVKERRGSTKQKLRRAGWDTTMGMLFSNVVMYFIILAAAATLNKAGKTDIQSATDAAQALRPLAGNGAYLLLALGLIGTGFLAVPILTGSTAYVICESMGWECSLDKKPQHAKKFYGIIAVSTFLGVGISFMGVSPMKVLYWTAVINGFLAPPLLIVIMLMANNRKIMGDKVNSSLTNVLGWVTTSVMVAAVIGLVASWFKK